MPNKVSSSGARQDVQHPEFASRFESACDNNPDVPAQHYGRLGWIAEQLSSNFGMTVSAESVRRWTSGQARPRAKTISMLAKILKVDEAWLSVGSGEMEKRDTKFARLAEDGAVNVLAGMILMCGNHPAFPTEDDKRAAADRIDLYAIIKGAQYAFHVSTAKKKGEHLEFVVPVAASNAVVIGVVMREDLCVEFYEIPQEVLETLEIKSNSYRLSIEGDLAGHGLRRITSFADRI